MRLFPTTSHRDHWQRFLSKFPLHSYHQGELILLQDEPPGQLYVIKSGLVKTYGISSEGEERPVSFDTHGEIFPIAWVFGKTETTQHFYQAFTDCQIYLMPRPDFLRYLRQHPKMGYELYAGLAGRFASLQARIFALQQSKATEKIIYTLLYLCERFGTSLSGTVAKLKISLTQQELANFVGLTRETTSVELKKLERQGVLSHNQKEYVVHLAKLKALLD